MSDKDSTLFDDLRALDEACGPQSNKHDRLTVLLTACIERGINTRPRLISVMKHLNFDQRHIAIMLDDRLGREWQRGPDGRYSVLT